MLEVVLRYPHGNWHFCFKQGLWEHSLQIELVNTYSFSAHILDTRGTNSFERSCEKNNDNDFRMIYNQILSTTWCQESSETEFPLKLMSLLNTGLERSPFSVLPIFVFPPTWISDLDSNTLHKMLRVVFQENLFHSREWLGERGGSRGNPCEVRFSKLPELPNPTLKSLRHIHH